MASYINIQGRPYWFKAGKGTYGLNETQITAEDLYYDNEKLESRWNDLIDRGVVVKTSGNSTFNQKIEGNLEVEELKVTGGTSNDVLLGDGTFGVNREYQAGTNITIDNTNPNAPVINSTGGGGTTPSLTEVLDVSGIDETGKNFIAISQGTFEFDESTYAFIAGSRVELNARNFQNEDERFKTEYAANKIDMTTENTETGDYEEILITNEDGIEFRNSKSFGTEPYTKLGDTLKVSDKDNLSDSLEVNKDGITLNGSDVQTFQSGKSGSVALTSDIPNLIAGSNVTINQSGNNFTINSTGGSGSSNFLTSNESMTSSEVLSGTGLFLTLTPVTGQVAVLHSVIIKSTSGTTYNSGTLSIVSDNNVITQIDLNTISANSYYQLTPSNSATILESEEPLIAEVFPVPSTGSIDLEFETYYTITNLPTTGGGSF